MSLKEADRVKITILVDNVTDPLIRSSPPAKRAPFFKGKETLPSPRAEHGFSALIDVYRHNASHRVLFDTGASGEVILFNINRFGVDINTAETIVLSHGHSDHAGGLIPILQRIDKPQTPIILHPNAFFQRWLILPTGQEIRLQSMKKDKVLAAGAKVVEITEPFPLAGNLLIATSEIPRKTQFEQGFPGHFAEIDGKLQPDPQVRDDQALVMNLKGKGLVIVAGCAHAGIINTVLYAQELTGVHTIYALIGGFHLSFPNEKLIDPTVAELKKIKPTFIIPCHDTGWKAVNTILNAMPQNFIPSSVGTTFIF